MTYDHPLLRLTLSAALTFAMTACGGGGDGTASSAETPVAAPANSFSGTAYLKTSNTILTDGRSTGPARDVAQLSVDQCNGFRSGFYGLPPVAPSETTMASLDVRLHEKWFDTDKARTYITGPALTLPDVQRWSRDLTAAGGVAPAVPPDCTGTVVEVRNGTIWRDGLMYTLRYDTLQAVGGRSPTTTPTAYPTTAAFGTLPVAQQIGQTCRQVTGASTGLATDSQSCVWDLFPYMAYLNWPYALSGRVQFGPTTAGTHETIVPIEARRGRAIDPAVFAFPTGFVVTN